MTVYVVRSDDFDSQYPVAVFSDRDVAQEYADIRMLREGSSFEVDEFDVDQPLTKI